MFPVLFQTESFTLYSYGLFLALAYLIAIEAAFRRAEFEGFDARTFSNFMLLLIVSAFGGSRLFFVWLEWPMFADDPMRIFKIWQGGFVFYGGLLICFSTVFPYALYHSMGVVRVADLCFPSVALGHAIGRIGCLGVGCCYGAPTDLPWGIQLPYLIRDGVFGPDVYIHPVQAYASASLFCLFVLLEWQWRVHRYRYPGWVFILYCYYQCFHRYTMETFRVDPRGGTFHFGMTVSQEIAVGLGLVAVTLHVLARTYYWPKFADRPTHAHSARLAEIEAAEAEVSAQLGSKDGAAPTPASAEGAAAADEAAEASAADEAAP